MGRAGSGQSFMLILGRVGLDRVMTTLPKSNSDTTQKIIDDNTLLSKCIGIFLLYVYFYMLKTISYVYKLSRFVFCDCDAKNFT